MKKSRPQIIVKNPSNPVARLRSLYNLFADHKEGGWIMIPQNAMALYKLVKEYPVKRILDLGTGIGLSATMIALAMHDKGEDDYELHTVEQYEKCVLLAKDLIPEELQKNITFHREEVVAWSNPHFPYVNFSIYENLPEGHFDLQLQDGPGPWERGGRYVDLHNGTILKMLLEEPNRIRTGDLIAFDGRIHSLKTIERIFGDNFYIINPAEEFNVIERKDNPVNFKDNNMTRMNKWNYFGEANSNAHTKMDYIREAKGRQSRGVVAKYDENGSAPKVEGRPEREL